jgi:hypothetical protein
MGKTFALSIVLPVAALTAPRDRMDVFASHSLNRLGGRMRLTRRFIFLPGAEACLSDSRASACQ